MNVITSDRVTEVIIFSTYLTTWWLAADRLLVWWSTILHNYKVWVIQTYKYHNKSIDTKYVIGSILNNLGQLKRSTPAKQARIVLFKSPEIRLKTLKARSQQMKSSKRLSSDQTWHLWILTCWNPAHTEFWLEIIGPLWLDTVTI